MMNHQVLCENNICSCSDFCIWYYSRSLNLLDVKCINSSWIPNKASACQSCVFSAVMQDCHEVERTPHQLADRHANLYDS